MLSSVSNNIPNAFNAYTTQQNRQVNEQDDNSQLTKPRKSNSITGKLDPKLSQEEQQELLHLQARDQEVKTHEQAHLSAAGGIATGGASFSYQKGPDGVNYATGGEVNIDTAPVPGDLPATLQKAETIRRAALAPANPSSQDRKVASEASAMANKARADLFEENQKKSETDKQDTLDYKINLSV